MIGIWSDQNKSINEGDKVTLYRAKVDHFVYAMKVVHTMLFFLLSKMFSSLFWEILEIVIVYTVALDIRR